MGPVVLFEPLHHSKLPRSRVELHIHLDGSFRISTIWDLSKKKGINLGFETFEDLKEAIIVKSPVTLGVFLEPFAIFEPVFIGDADALERAAYELCEDQANEGVLYFEARYSPHECANTHSPYLPNLVDKDSPEAFTPRQVVQSINRGLKKGEKDFEIKARSILCCIRGNSDWNEEVLNLCQEFASAGVVGIDIAGDEGTSEILTRADVAIFQRAFEKGIHRTVHAGEAGPSSNVLIALKDMHAERIGHGYAVLQDELLYQEVQKKGIHLEACPYSSLLTGAVPLTTPKHPIVRFAEDGVNFSINKDDTTVIGKTLTDEYKLLRKMGFNEAHFVRANFNAARSCFLPEPEKRQLLEQLQDIYGVKY